MALEKNRKHKGKHLTSEGTAASTATSSPLFSASGSLIRTPIRWAPHAEGSHTYSRDAVASHAAPPPPPSPSRLEKAGWEDNGTHCAGV